jgi:G3E family GTPase
MVHHARSLPVVAGLVMKPVPVTLVTGFLGAGKTTLLNRVLSSNSGRKFAIIENEYGDLGVDGALLSNPRDAVYELNDGCVCCTVRDDLIAVFEQLLDRPDQLDHVIIETTGLAEPAPVLRIFDIPFIQDAFRLDGVVTVVDAAHIEESMSDVSTCAEQISYADLIILNKVDCLAETELDSLEDRLKHLNPLAVILRANHAQVDVETVLDLGGRTAEESVSLHHSHDHGTHQHDDAIQSFFVEADGDVDVVALDRWLGRLVRQRGSTMLRMKGILAVPGDPRRFVFNGVRSVIDVRPDRSWEQDTRASRIVFIGRGLDAQGLQAGFAACMSEAAPPS